MKGGLEGAVGSGVILRFPPPGVGFGGDRFTSPVSPSPGLAGLRVTGLVLKEGKAVAKVATRSSSKSLKCVASGRLFAKNTHAKALVSSEENLSGDLGSN